MRSTEVVRALERAVAAGLLTEEQAAPLSAVARGDVVSIRGELRALLGLAVVLVTTGVGLLIAEHREKLGPLPVAVLLAAGAAVALYFVARRSPAFTWSRAAGKDWTVDALLLLALGLLSADLGWIESQFDALGPNWPLHLLLMSLLTAALAVRFDSLPAWSLALTTFAAWRGVAFASTPTELERALFRRESDLRLELLVCGLLFLVLGRLAAHFDRKAWFEPATTMLAYLAAGSGLVAGAFENEGWWPWALALAVLGAVTSVWAFRKRRRALLALGALGIYIAVTRAVFELWDSGQLGCLWLLVSTVGAIVLLVVVHRHFERTKTP